MRCFNLKKTFYDGENEMILEITDEMCNENTENVMEKPLVLFEKGKFAHF